MYKVAIIGAGPAGFYATSALLKKYEGEIRIDLFDRLPAPYGLVRYGVAPDHEKIKNVRRVFDKSANHDSFRFFGNVEYGKDIDLDELRACYDHILFTVGCQSARKLGIEGESSGNVISATEFVYWYNGHPDYVDLNPDLSGSTAVVIGAGNVALDVARILIRDLDELKITDIADHAIECLSKSNIKDVHVLARRGPAQAKFTSPELKEFGELENVQALVREEELVLDPVSQQLADSDSGVAKIVGLINGFDRHIDPSVDRRVHFRFLVSPKVISGDPISAVRLVRNELHPSDSGYLNSIPTDKEEILDCSLLVPSVGYRGNELPGLPFNEKRGRIPNLTGRVEGLDDVYLAGWTKRGPSGVVGTNKADASETAVLMIEDYEQSNPMEKGNVDQLLGQKQIVSVSFGDWLKIKESEEQHGESQGRPRVKYTIREQFLSFVGKQ